jgi:N-acetylmuramic acid 6-phosphate etherase
LRSLKAVVYYYDRDAVWSRLGQKLLRVLQLNEPDELIGWVQSACKKEVAALAVEVFKAAKERDEIALDILAGAVASLACDAVACAQRLVRKNARIQFVFAGSVLLKQPSFAKQVAAELHKRWRHSAITHLKRESVYGAIELARQLAGRSQPCAHSEIISTSRRSFKLWTSDAPTEQRNPRSMKLDKLSVADAISLMLSEDQKISAALAKARKEIEQAVLLIVRAFREHGRLFYVGAGTSGRLGILDASECPPTFGSSPEMVQGIIAGGQRALWEAVEGAEDDFEAGSRAIKFRGVEGRDVVVGIAASGRTPFVWGALEEARRSRAKTVLLCFNPHLKLAHAPDVLIAPNVGPEVLTGSTRLKAGTATKQILNILTTLAMVRLGKVLENLMVDLKPTNSKLRDRAVRIVQDLTGTGPNSALAALESSAWEIKRAIKKIKE